MSPAGAVVVKNIKAAIGKKIRSGYLYREPTHAGRVAEAGSFARSRITKQYQGLGPVAESERQSF